MEDVKPSRPGDQLVVTDDEIRVLQDELKPYWEDHQYHKAFAKALPKETREIVMGKHIITCTAISRHMLAWAHDYEKVLKRGINGLKAEAEERLKTLNPLEPKDVVEKRPFLEAVIIVGDAIIDFAGRYAVLARGMAEKGKG